MCQEFQIYNKNENRTINYKVVKKLNPSMYEEGELVWHNGVWAVIYQELGGTEGILLAKAKHGGLDFVHSNYGELSPANKKETNIRRPNLLYKVMRYMDRYGHNMNRYSIVVDETQKLSVTN